MGAIPVSLRDSPLLQMRRELETWDRYPSRSEICLYCKCDLEETWERYPSRSEIWLCCKCYLEETWERYPSRSKIWLCCKFDREETWQRYPSRSEISCVYKCEYGYRLVYFRES